MKKFEFSLSKLLKYKLQILDREKNALSELRHKKATAEEELANQKKLLTISNESYIEQTAKGMSAQVMITTKRYLSYLSDKIFQLEKIISIYTGQIEKQLVVVVEATKEVNTVEKLEEKQRQDYKEAERKENELFIQELVTNQQSYPNKV